MNDLWPHQPRCLRSYDFAHAASHLRTGDIVGWVVNEEHAPCENDYGVLRYVTRGRIAWLESVPFGDADAAEHWVRTRMAELDQLQTEEEQQRTMPQEQNLAAWLEAKQKLQEKLQAAGITEQDYIELYRLLDVVTRTDLEAIRTTQFREDAYDLCVDLKAASERNVLRASAFLRQFAEHVIRQTAPDGTEGDTIDAQVDAIPTLVSWAEK